MSEMLINGGKSLLGDVEVSGAKNSALKILIASLFSNEEITISNLPKIKSIQKEIEIMESLGSKVDYVNDNLIRIDNSKLHSFEIPEELGKNLFTSYLFAGPLLFRFGEAKIPLPDSGIESIEKFLDTWSKLNIEINFDDKFLYLRSDNYRSADIEIPYSSHMATDNAILCSIFSNGVIRIINTSEAIEVKDLIDFCNLIGAQIEFENKKVLKIFGKKHFKGTYFEIVSDLSEVVFFAVLALITNGNIIIKNVNKSHLSFLMSFLNRIEATYEFTSNEELRVWKKSGNLKGFEITVGSYPNITSDFVSYFVALALFCEGESKVYETSYKNKLDYIYQLKKYSSKIKIFEGLKDYEKCEIILNNMQSINISKYKVETFYTGIVFFLIALGLDSKTEILNYEILDEEFEKLISKVVKLGAEITYA
jgi:UDP-N-acetylglucosamine 1-carboxyvinyltransferase